MSTSLQQDVAVETKISEPPPWNVIFHNDDYTTIDFVVMLLVEVFDYSESSAFDKALSIHNQDRDSVAQYVFEIAEQKASICMALAQQFGFPFQATIEASDK